MIAILLGLAAGCSWGVSDFLGGFKSRDMPVLTVLVVSQPIGLVLAGAAVAVHHVAPPSWEFLAAGFAGGVANVIGLAAFYRSMAIGKISIVAPVAAMSPTLPVLAGLLVGERPSGWRTLGMAAAVIGVVLISMRFGDDATPPSRAALPLAAVAAVAFGLTFIFVHRASQGDVLWGILLQRIGMVTLVALWSAAARNWPTALSKGALPVLVAIGILDVSGTTLFGLASVIGMVGLSAVLASLHPVTTIIVARIVAYERLNRYQLAGIGVTLLGIVVISANG